jgi:dimethylargininase
VQKRALVRRPGPRLDEGLLTHLDRQPVDLELARRQWLGYVAALQAEGWELYEVDPADDCPDAVFVEDTAVVYGDLAVITRPGADERKPETAATEQALSGLGYRIARIEEPGTLDGGDVLSVGRTLYVGRGGRTNEEGIRALGELAASRGYEVVTVPLRGVLHLKSAVTALPDGTIVAADEGLVDAGALPPLRMVPEEAGSHVVPLGGDTVLMAASAPRTAAQLADAGLEVVAVEIGEFEKMEGCVTCLSVLVEA